MSVRIDPDGTITPIPTTRPLDAARAELEWTSVVKLEAPFLGDDTWVGVIDDFGAADLPLNRKAWALYGRSPIYGRMWIGTDATGQVSQHVLDIIATDIDAWPIPTFAKARLSEHHEPERPDMLADRPTKEA